MKRALKTILFTILSVVVTLGLVIGGMYLFGGFDEKRVYASNLTFSETNIVTSSTRLIQISTTTENVTRKTVKLECSAGGNNILDFPSTAEIDSVFAITPKRTSNGENVGGYVELYARYIDDLSTSTARAVCKILIDTPATSVLFANDIADCHFGERVLLAQSGQKVSEIFSVAPVSAFSYYPKASNVQKRMFLRVSADGVVDANLVCFGSEVTAGIQNATTIEVEYSYSQSAMSFVFDKDIYLYPKKDEIKINVDVFLVPVVVDGQIDDEITIENNKFLEYATIANTTQFSVLPYSIDSMTIDQSSKTIYFNENTNFYFSNEESSENDVNLNIRFENKDGLEVVGNRVFDYLTLTVSAGNVQNSGKLLNKNLSQEQWKFGYILKDYSFASVSEDNPPIVATISYDDGTYTFGKSFNLVPVVRDVDVLTVNFDEEGDTSFVRYNGDSSKNNLDLNGKVVVSSSMPGRDPLATGVIYYISQSLQNEVKTFPNKTGTNFKACFEFFLKSDLSINAFTKTSNWASLAGSTVNFVQGTKTASIQFDSSANSSISSGGDVVFEAAVPILVEVAGLGIESVDVNENDPLFRIDAKLGSKSETINITAKQTKFYEGTSAFAYFNVNEVQYNVDFDIFVDESGNTFFVINTNLGSVDGSYNLSGVGSFVVTARTVYQQDGSATYYKLNKTTSFTVVVIENLSDISVFNGAIDAPFATSVIEIDENGDSNSGYLYVTSSKLGALQNCIEAGDVVFAEAEWFANESEISSVATILGVEKTDPAVEKIKSQVAEINKNAIEFDSTWTTVTQGNLPTGAVIGYRIGYTIRQVFECQVGSVTLSNTFKIRVYAKLNYLKIIEGEFLIAENPDIKTLLFEINDKSIKNTAIKYSDNEVHEMDVVGSVGTSGNLRWKVSANGVDYSDITSFDSLTYGFYGDDSSVLSTNSITRQLSVVKNGVQSDLPTSFYSFDSNGVLTLKNVPISSPDYLVLKIYSTSESDSNTHFVWKQNTNEFKKEIYPGVKDGASLNIFVTNVGVEIFAKQTESIDGRKDSSVKLFGGDNRLFDVKLNGNLQTNAKFEQFFSVSVVQNPLSNNNLRVEIEMDGTYELKIVKDFLVDGSVGLAFNYFGQSSYPIFVDNKLQCDIFFGAAFQIEVETNFQAPGNKIFGSVKYNNNNLTFSNGTSTGDEVTLVCTTNGVALSLNIAKQTPDDRFEIDNSGNLVFKSTPQEFYPKLKFTLVQGLDSDVKIYSNNEIVAVPIYSENDLEFDSQKLVFASVEDAHLSVDASPTRHALCGFVAGVTNVVNFGDEIVLKGELLSRQNSIQSVAISFASADENEDVGEFMHTTQVTSFASNPGFFAYDIDTDKQIVVRFEFLFDDGGTFVIEKQVLMLANFKLTFAPSRQSINKDNSLDLSDENTYQLKTIKVVDLIVTDADSCEHHKLVRDFDARSFDPTLDESQFYNGGALPAELFASGENAVYDAQSFDWQEFDGLLDLSAENGMLKLRVVTTESVTANIYFDYIPMIDVPTYVVRVALQLKLNGGQ